MCHVLNEHQYVLGFVGLFTTGRQFMSDWLLDRWPSKLLSYLVGWSLVLCFVNGWLAERSFLCHLLSRPRSVNAEAQKQISFVLLLLTVRAKK